MIGPVDPRPILDRQGQWTDRRFATRLGVDPRTLGQWRKGEKMAPHVAERCAAKLGLSVEKTWPSPPYDPNWRKKAACVGMDLDQFFPPRGGAVEQAKAVCWTCCPVRESCLHWTMTHVRAQDDYGIVGGTSHRERRAIRAAGRLEVA